LLRKYKRMTEEIIYSFDNIEYVYTSKDYNGVSISATSTIILVMNESDSDCGSVASYTTPSVAPFPTAMIVRSRGDFLYSSNL